MCCLSVSPFSLFSRHFSGVTSFSWPDCPASASVLSFAPSQRLLQEPEKPKFDFKVSLLEPLACLVNQHTLLSCLTVWLAGWLAGWLQRGPMRDNRRKESSHTHTLTRTHKHTHFQVSKTVADGFNSSPSFFHNLSGNPL